MFIHAQTVVRSLIGDILYIGAANEMLPYPSPESELARIKLSERPKCEGQ
jgi:hypothetical protein